MTTLRTAPFNLEFGDSVHAKIIAVNVVGDSEYSESGNGALIPLDTASDPMQFISDRVPVLTMYATAAASTAFAASAIP